MSEEKKPADAGKAFADLASKLMRVPKREIDRAAKRYERRKQKRKKS